MIAGNHDNAAAFEALRPLLAAARHHGARPRRAGPTTAAWSSVDDAGRRAGTCRAAAVLLAALRRCAPRADGAATPPSTPASYAERMRALARRARAPLRGRHGQRRRRALHGARRHARRRRARRADDVERTGSRRTAFPPRAHYVALGHLHRTQRDARRRADLVLGLADPGRLRRGGRRQARARRRRRRRRRRPRSRRCRSTAARGCARSRGHARGARGARGRASATRTSGSSSHETGARRAGRRRARAARRPGRRGAARAPRPTAAGDRAATRADAAPHELFASYLAEQEYRRRPARRAVRPSCSTTETTRLMRPVRLELAGFGVVPRADDGRLRRRRLLRARRPDRLGQVDRHRRDLLRALRQRAPLRPPACRRAGHHLGAQEAKVALDLRRRRASATSRRASCGGRRRAPTTPEARLERLGDGEVLAGRRARWRPRSRRCSACRSSTSRSASCSRRASSRASCTTSRPTARTCSSSCSTSASTRAWVSRRRAAGRRARRTRRRARPAPARGAGGGREPGTQARDGSAARGVRVGARGAARHEAEARGAHQDRASSRRRRCERAAELAALLRGVKVPREVTKLAGGAGRRRRRARRGRGAR